MNLFIYNFSKKTKEIKSHIESQNYFNKINLDNAKYERPKKSFIERNDCLDKDFKDKSPITPQVPQKKPIKDYEKRNHREKIVRKPKTIIPQSDNVFNFEPPEKNKNRKYKNVL